MKWSIFTKCFLLVAIPFQAFCNGLPSFPGSEKEPELIVHNRILAVVNGNPISVLDVMKKMDVFLSQHYPEVEKTDAMRFQFFNQNWKHTLKQLVDNQLILADAEKMEMKITDAEIRETLHERFGPNVMANLDRLGISLEEAQSMVYSEMAVQKMTGYRVYFKGMEKVGPQDIKVAYEDHLTNHPPKEEWKYRVLSIRATTEGLGNVYAQKASALLRSEPLPFEMLAKQLKEENKDDPSISINVSDEYEVEGSHLSEAHKSVLTSLSPGTYSEPIAQVSRVSNSIVHRIFHLIDHVQESAPSFDSMVDQLHDRLVEQEISKIFPDYISKLQSRFNYNPSEYELPSDFQPFELK